METAAFVGVVDEKVKRDQTQNEQLTWTDNKLGGRPTYSDQCRDRIQPETVTCSGCLRPAAFVFQISCPVDFVANDRVLYFFACVTAKCPKKECFLYRAITPSLKTTNEPDDKLFDDGWDSESNGSSSADQLCQSVEQKLNLNEAQPVESNTATMECFEPFYIAVIEEAKDCETMPRDEIKNLEKVVQDCLGEREGDEAYEKSYPSGFKNDETSFRFYKRLKRCPEQIIRYQWCGYPLYPSRTAKAKPTPCQACGSDRVFELQLMPAMISALRCHKHDEKEVVSVNLDFETILVYTCSKNCTTPNVNFYKEEVFLFQENFKLNDI